MPLKKKTTITQEVTGTESKTIFSQIKNESVRYFVVAFFGFFALLVVDHFSQLALDSRVSAQEVRIDRLETSFTKFAADLAETKGYAKGTAVKVGAQPIIEE